MDDVDTGMTMIKGMKTTRNMHGVCKLFWEFVCLMQVTIHACVRHSGEGALMT